MARTPNTLDVSGAKLRELRDRAGLHQIEVEERTAAAGHRVDRAWLSKIENGLVRPSAKAMRALVQVYGVEIDDVLAEAS